VLSGPAKRVQRPASASRRPTPRVQAPASRVNARAPRVQALVSRVQAPVLRVHALVSRVRGLCIGVRAFAPTIRGLLSPAQGLHAWCAPLRATDAPSARSRSVSVLCFSRKPRPARKATSTKRTTSFRTSSSRCSSGGRASHRHGSRDPVDVRGRTGPRARAQSRVGRGPVEGEHPAARRGGVRTSGHGPPPCGGDDALPSPS